MHARLKLIISVPMLDFIKQLNFKIIWSNSCSQNRNWKSHEQIHPNSFDAIDKETSQAKEDRRITLREAWKHRNRDRLYWVPLIRTQLNRRNIKWLTCGNKQTIKIKHWILSSRKKWLKERLKGKKKWIHWPQSDIKHDQMINKDEWLSECLDQSTSEQKNT